MTGPVIDCHHHLWDLGMGRHRWLDPEAGLGGLGDLGYLRRSFGVEDFLRASAGTGVVASVHVEAQWDPARNPAEETGWLDTLPLRDGVAARCVAGADLLAPGAALVLARHAAHPRVAGIRQNIRWNPDPARSWIPHDLVNDPAWQRAAAALVPHGLLLELLMSPWQLQAVAALARALPELPIVINHCASPMERDAAGLDRWRRGLALAGARPNVHLKLSNAARYAFAPTPEGVREVLATCLNAFGAERCLWASDYPVSSRLLGYAEALDLFRDAASALPEADRHAVLHGNAARLYRIP